MFSYLPLRTGCLGRNGFLLSPQLNGLQNIQTIVPTERKLEWLRDTHQAGIREIEVGSFMPARLLPQLADTPCELPLLAGCRLSGRLSVLSRKDRLIKKL
jgi:hypothetical protein